MSINFVHILVTVAALSYVLSNQVEAPCKTGWDYTEKGDRKWCEMSAELMSAISDKGNDINEKCVELGGEEVNEFSFSVGSNNQQHGQSYRCVIYLDANLDRMNLNMDDHQNNI